MRCGATENGIVNDRRVTTSCKGSVESVSWVKNPPVSRPGSGALGSVLEWLLTTYGPSTLQGFNCVYVVCSVMMPSNAPDLEGGEGVTFCARRPYPLSIHQLEIISQ